MKSVLPVFTFSVQNGKLKNTNNQINISQMKEIKLRKLKMTYFKGFKDFEVDFSDRTVISGKNGSGKSTIADAWFFLLFGKDSLGAADFQIKTLEDGKVIEKVDHEVYGELEINGAITTLKRVVRENWVKPRGQENEILKGHDTKCFFDGVPVSVGEYNQRVNEIINEDLFKLITNINYFHSLKKDDRRNILVSLAGNVTNESIAESKPEFQEILDLLGSTSNEDLKRKIAAEKKRINAELSDIPIRIDELQKNMPEAVDFKEIETQITEKKKELSEIDKSINDRQESVKAKIEQANEKRKQIGDLRLKQQDIIIEAGLDAQKVASEKNKDFHNYKSILDEKEDKVKRAERRAIEKKNDITIVNNKLSELKKEREKLVEQWKSENAKVYEKKDGCLVCPLYNHKCQDNEALFKFSQGATDSELEFNERKNKALSEINKSGLGIKAQIEEREKELSKLESELLSLNSELESIFGDWKAFSEMTPVEYKAEPVVKENLPEWVELEEKIKFIKIEEVKQDNSDLIEKKEKLNEEILSLSVELNKKSIIENTFKRIDELNKEQRILSQALSEQEKIEFKLLQFNKAKMEEVDKRINGLFKHVSFKLFDVTLEGNEFETCETLIDGVPYFSANNAGRVNGALDIINAICDYNKIYAPIVIDNAESINEVIPTKSQLIQLVVTREEFKVE